MSDIVDGLRNALELGIHMREAQTTYFKTRSKDALVAAKNLEAEFLSRARAALSNGPAGVRETHWRPIGTAPLNGDEILVWDSMRFVDVAYWDPLSLRWTNGDHQLTPTHWMPLPEPPK